jgi:hypothetical protein
MISGTGEDVADGRNLIDVGEPPATLATAPKKKSSRRLLPGHLGRENAGRRAARSKRAARSMDRPARRRDRPVLAAPRIWFEEQPGGLAQAIRHALATWTALSPDTRTAGWRSTTTAAKTPCATSLPAASLGCPQAPIPAAIEPR